MYHVDKFLNALYDRTLPHETLLSCDDAGLHPMVIEKRRAFRNALRIDDWAAMATQQSLSRLGAAAHEGGRLTEYAFTFLPELTVPLWVLEPEHWNGLSMLYLHGHDQYGAKGSFTRIEEDAYHKHVPLVMAGRGYKVIIPELVGFGETTMAGFKEREYAGCYGISTNLLMNGYSMAGLRVFEAMSALSIMKDEWGKKRVCAFGISGGGLVASFLAAIDHHHLDAVVVSGYANTFRDCVLSLYHCVDNFPPGLLAVSEMPEIISLAAPIPLLISSGKDDPIFPVAGTEEAIRQVGDIYTRLGYSDRFESEIFDGEHETSFEKMLDFYDTHMS